MAEYKRPLRTAFLLALEEASSARGQVAALARMRRWADEWLGDRRRKVDEELRGKVADWLKEERSLVWIARETGLSEPTVRALARNLRLTRVRKIKKL